VLTIWIRLPLLALVAAALPMAPAAAMLTINLTLDPAKLILDTDINEFAIKPAFVAVGDTVVLTFRLPGTARLELPDRTLIWLGLLAAPMQPDRIITAEGVLSFTGRSTNLVAATAPLTQIDQTRHIGNSFTSDLFQTAPGAYRFATVRQTFTLLADSRAPRRRYLSAFIFFGLPRNVPPAAAAPVPEPTSWALLIAGFGLSGAALRRRRAVAG
jgi:hypothetical protein